MNKRYILILIYIFALLKAVFFSRVGFGLLDEGESLHNATRILNDQLPYRDFYAIFPPLDNYFFALIFKHIGSTVILSRIVMSIIYSFLPVFIYLIISKLSDHKLGLLLASLTIFLDVNVERMFFLTFIYMAIYLFNASIQKNNPSKIIVSGLLFGGISLFRFDLPGAYFLGFMIASLFYFYQKHRYWKSEWILNSSVFTLGYIIPVIFLSLWLVKNNLVNGFLTSTVLNSVEVTKLHALPFPGVNELFPRSINMNEAYKTYEAFLGYGILSVYLFAMVSLNRSTKWVNAGFLLTGILSLPYIFGRSDVGHFIKGGLPAMILFALISKKTKATRFIAMSVLLLILVVNIMQHIWWLHFNDQRTVVSGNNLTLNSIHLSGSTLPSAGTLNESAMFLKNNTNKDEYVLALPYMAGLYYLSDRPAPTKYNNVLAGFINTPEQENEFIQEIEEKDVRVVVYDPVNGPKMENNRLRDYNPIIHNHIMENFEIIEETPEGWLFMMSNE